MLLHRATPVVALLLVAASCAPRMHPAPALPTDAVTTIGPAPTFAPRVEASGLAMGGGITRLTLSEPLWVAIVVDYGGAFELFYPFSNGMHNRWDAGTRQWNDRIEASGAAAHCADRRGPVEYLTDPVTGSRIPVPGTGATFDNCAARGRPRGVPRQVVYLASRAELRYADVRRAIQEIDPVRDASETIGLLAQALEHATAGRLWGATVVRNPNWKPSDYENLIR